METYHFGVTASRHGISDRQAETFEELVTNTKSALLTQFQGQIEIWFHHGDCVGGDERAAKIVENLGGIKIHCHPPFVEKYRAWTTNWDLREEPLDYHTRNHVIVRWSRMIVAMPRTTRWTPHSGTWATMRWAQNHGKVVNTIWPSGRLTNSRGWEDRV